MYHWGTGETLFTKSKIIINEHLQYLMLSCTYDCVICMDTTQTHDTIHPQPQLTKACNFS